MKSIYWIDAGLYPHLVKLTGSISAALLLTQAIGHQIDCESHDGWWCNTMDDWRESTGMGRDQLERARKRCSKYLKCKRKGVPATNWFKVDESALQSDLLKALGLVQSKWVGRFSKKSGAIISFERMAQ